MLIVDVLDVLLLVIDALIFQLRVLMINVTIFKYGSANDHLSSAGKPTHQRNNQHINKSKISYIKTSAGRLSGGGCPARGLVPELLQVLLLARRARH